MSSINESIASTCQEFIPFHAYLLKPVPPLLPYISDLHLSLVIPLVTYWALGLFFHWCDISGHFQQYRIHTSAEEKSRNCVSRGECLRGVLLNQSLQTLLGAVAGWTGDGDFHGSEAYDVAKWALRFRQLKGILPNVLVLIAIDVKILDQFLKPSYPWFAAIISPSAECSPGSDFNPLELLVGQTIYHIIIPFVLFVFAVLIADSWQYFGHRWMHQNKFMYSTFTL